MVVNFISGLITPKADYMVYVVIAENPVPSFITTDNFMNHCLSESVGDFYRNQQINFGERTSRF